MRLSRSVVGSAEADAVTRVLCEDGYLGMGSEVQKFEEDIASFLGVPASHVVSVNSGTAALHLAAESAVGDISGAEVLIPSLTFVASFQAVRAAGAVPVACDVLEKNGLLDLQDAERRLTEHTKAVMPVHYAGNPGDLDAVYAFASKHDLRVIEDAAHAFGCQYRGRRVGSFSDVACFSFDGIKNITCGEGGCIVTSDEVIAERCRDARLLSVAKDTEKRFSGQRSWDFDVERQGWRYHMSNIMAAIGRVQLGRFEQEFAPARRELAQRYREKLRRVAGIALLEENSDTYVVPHIFPVRILDGKREFASQLLEQKGIQVGRHYKPNHLLTLFGGGRESLPIAEKLYSELLTLPLHPALTLSDIDEVCSVLIQSIR
ncbi:MAG: DegT/DnrJ/EryC1/StrS family aminotransferase [Desulfovibrionaceae bacterium]|nr:DegT/DnrJ/EryC1/StrS family aminotransferase [Desulfovibrionaceae bacterium]